MGVKVSIEDIRIAFRFVIRKPDGEISLEDVGADGRILCSVESVNNQKKNIVRNFFKNANINHFIRDGELLWAVM
jgi:hypothetical protein